MQISRETFYFGQKMRSYRVDTKQINGTERFVVELYDEGLEIFDFVLIDWSSVLNTIECWELRGDSWLQESHQTE